MSFRRTIASVGLAAGILLVPAAPALAQYTGPTPPQVLPFDTQKPRPTVEVKGEKQTRSVAVTGADVAGMAVLGGLAIGSGMVIRRASRRRSS